MSFDNRVFNVNGRTLDELKKTIELAFLIDGKHTVAKSWHFHPENGLVFSWDGDSGDTYKHRFLVPLTAEPAALIAWDWLKTDEAKKMKFDGQWDCDMDHDGSNVEGWRVFVQEWGHVGGDRYAICCVRPVYLWLGK